tara:strand:- start:30577 stop:30753 length:177 start_codon:yes stop_codon:yes gene_type:complete
MKNLALTAATLAILAAPTAGFAQDLFPDLTFPDTWGSTVTVSQDTVAKPIIPLLPADE